MNLIIPLPLRYLALFFSVLIICLWKTKWFWLSMQPKIIFFCHFPPIQGFFLIIISHLMKPTTLESRAALDVVGHDLWLTTVFWIFRKNYVHIYYFHVDYVEISGYPSWVKKTFSVFRGDLRKFTSLEKRLRLLSS